MIPVFPHVDMDTPDLASRELNYNDVPALRSVFVVTAFYLWGGGAFLCMLHQFSFAICWSCPTSKQRLITLKGKIKGQTYW